MGKGLAIKKKKNLGGGPFFYLLKKFRLPLSSRGGDGVRPSCVWCVKKMIFNQTAHSKQ